MKVKLRSRTFLFVVLLACTSVSNSAHIGNVTVKRIRIQDTFAIVTTNEAIIKSACANSGTEHTFILPLDESHSSNRKLSLLLAAHAQKKWINPDCDSTQCFNIEWLGGNLTQCRNMTIE